MTYPAPTSAPEPATCLVDEARDSVLPLRDGAFLAAPISKL
jgi:hypothetical protein